MQVQCENMGELPTGMQSFLPEYIPQESHPMCQAQGGLTSPTNETNVNERDHQPQLGLRVFDPVPRRSSGLTEFSQQNWVYPNH